MELIIKNMVCDRCISTVKAILQKHAIQYEFVELGKAKLLGIIPPKILDRIERDLENVGLPILKSKGERLISELKQVIAEKALEDSEPEIILSQHVERSMGIPYRKLNIILSEFENKTINQYFIEVKIEKAKELISYDFQSISEISYRLNYSSPQHFSRQFKNVTGMTPSEFKKKGTRDKFDKI